MASPCGSFDKTPIEHPNPHSHRRCERNCVDVIRICDLEVSYRVGVPDAERARPQRLLLDVRMEHDFRPAAATDDLTKTIDYFAVAQKLLKFGQGREWKLIEKLAE